jgi:CRP-like cAMP-binding protein
MEWALLAGLSDADRRSVLSQARRRKFGRREVIFHEGDAGDSVHLIDKGHVAIRVTTPLGETALLRVLAPGEYFGEIVLLSRGNRSATAAAIEGAETLSLHRSVFDDLRSRSTAAQEALMEVLAGDVRRLSDALVDALYLPAETRLWRRLVMLAEVYSGDGSAAVPLTQEEIAQLAGVTRPTANRLLRDAQTAGAIALSRGQFVVTDLAWMQRRAK